MTHLSIPSFSLIDLDNVPSYASSPTIKSYPELPSFEEAFDTNSLRKFYQERESTTSLSALSPRKELFSLDESYFDHFDAKERDFLTSASSFSNLMKNTAPTSPQSSRSLLSLSFSNIQEPQVQKSNPRKAFRRAQSNQDNTEILKKPDPMDFPKKAENAKVVFKNGSMTFSKPTKTSNLLSEKLASSTNTFYGFAKQQQEPKFPQTALLNLNPTEWDREMKQSGLEGEQEPKKVTSEKLFRTKKIFKIIREKPRKVVHMSKPKRFIASYRRKKNDPKPAAKTVTITRPKLPCNYSNPTRALLLPTENRFKVIPPQQLEDVHYDPFMAPNHSPKKPIISFMN